MKKVFFIVFFLFSFSLFSQDSLYIDIWENGQKKESGEYNNNVKNGLWKKWNKKGEIIASDDYKNGKLTESYVYEYYNHTPFLLFLQKKFNGQKNILELREYNFQDNDKYHQTLYFENGKKSSEGVLNKDKMDGKWMFYDLNGKIEKTRKFKNGVDLVEGKKAKKEKKKGEKFFSAQVLTNKGEVLNGVVKKIKEGTTNYSNFGFWDMNEKRTYFAPYSVKKLTTQGFDFESIKLKQPPCMTCVNQVLMTEIISGNMTLYLYKHVKLLGGVSPISLTNTAASSTCIYYYYIRKKGEKSALMAMKRHCIKGILRTISQPNFKDFVAYFEETPLLQEKIKSKSYNRKEDLELIIQEYNNTSK
jgi:antitoxin component YwqK of YwqJK toxin-antitoxin module